MASPHASGTARLAKIRQIKAGLKALGFVNRGGKGDRTNWLHPQYPSLIVGVAGKDGDDCKHYNEADLLRVRAALKAFEESQRQERV